MYDHSSGIIGRATERPPENPAWLRDADVNISARSQEQAAYRHQVSATKEPASPIADLTERLAAAVAHFEVIAASLGASLDQLAGAAGVQAACNTIPEPGSAAIPRLNYLLELLERTGHAIGSEAARLNRIVG